jgi:fumarate hydratase subunit beta
MKRILTPLSASTLVSLKAGEEVRFTGTLYTARDQAHKRLCEALQRGKKLPLELRGQVIYYCGPTNTPPGRVIGSCGPTTSSRMDAFTPQLLERGLSAMIGKGDRSPEVAAAIKKHGAVYFLALAGCGALISSFVTSREIVAYPELGPEAIYKLTVEDLPLIVGIDSRGKNVFTHIQERSL